MSRFHLLQDGATPEEDIALRALSVGTSVKTFADRVKESPHKIPTGIAELDRVLGGGISNGLNVTCAAPNTGKTTICMQAAKNMVAAGMTVVYITNDMAPLELEAKIYSQISYSVVGEKCYTLNRLLNKNVLDKPTELSKWVTAEAEHTMQHLHIRDYIFDEDFDAYCKSVKGIDKLSKLEKIFYVYCNIYKDVIFILDSLQQIAASEGVGKEGVDSLLLTLKALGRTFDVPVVLISTLSRAGYNKIAPPTMSDLKESGSIEYDTETLSSIFPAFFLEENTKMTMSDFKEQEYREVIIECLKSRDSGGKREKMVLYAPGCTFISVDDKPTKEPKPAEKSVRVKKPATAVAGDFSTSDFVFPE